MTLIAIQPGPASIDDMIDSEHTLLWVERGTGTLHCGAETIRLVGGQAVWVPAGVRYRFAAAAGTLCFPIAVPTRHVVPPRQSVAQPRQSVAQRREPYVIEVPAGWRSWLIHQFTVAISPLRSVGPPVGGLGDLLRVGANDPDFVLPLPRTQLRQPTTPALVAISQQLMRDPAQPASVAEWAHQARISPRTLQRWFLAEVGVTFEDWRTACRLLASTEYLVAGYPVDWVAHRVGFQSASGFARAFAREFGLRPRSYVALAPASHRGTGGLDSDSTITDLFADSGGQPTEVRAIPASSTPPLVNNFHVIIWMYRGRSRARVGSTTYDLDTGDAIWLPACIANQVEVAADSIMVPLQSSPPPTRLTVDAVRVMPLRGYDEVALLRAAVAQYTWLRPPGYDELAGWYAFEQWATNRAAASTQPPAHPSAARPDSVNRATMETARGLLADGMRPTTVADRLGYAHLSSFSRAFSRQYGASPRAYQQHRSGAAFPPANVGR